MKHGLKSTTLEIDFQFGVLWLNRHCVIHIVYPDTWPLFTWVPPPYPTFAISLTQAGLFNLLLYTKKQRKTPQNTWKYPIQKLKYAFLALNLEFLTWQKFLHRHRMWCLWQISGLATTSEIALEPSTKKSGNNIHLYSAFLFLQYDENFWKL